MIGNSIAGMTVIDSIIIFLTALAFWNFYVNRMLLKRLKVFSGVALVMTGLVVIASLYVADILSMYLAPVFFSGNKTTGLMENLHHNYSWILSTIGVALIVSSLIYLNQIIFPKMSRMNDELKKRATTDSLTEAFNRSKFDELINRETIRARRYNSLLSLVVFDIDHFKRINDTFGHLAGDEVLKKIAAITRNNIRMVDYLIRWGGEEFMIILPETDLAKAEEMANRIKLAIECFDFNGNGKVTVSVGVTQHKRDDSEDTFIKRADDALYKAKLNGRNRVEVNV